jgi:hypothetical protein
MKTVKDYFLLIATLSVHRGPPSQLFADDMPSNDSL